MDLASPKVEKTGANSYSVYHGKDENLYVEFENVAIKNNFESEKQGRPIFHDKVHIRITFPGDKTKQVFRPIKEEDKMRFSKQWASFEATGKVVNVGTPLEQWAPLTKSEVAELKALNVFTVENLASLPDSALTWLGARNYRDKAKIWLENSKDGAALSALQAENKTLKDDIEMLKTQIKELANLKSKSKKGEE